MSEERGTDCGFVGKLALKKGYGTLRFWGAEERCENGGGVEHELS